MGSPPNFSLPIPSSARRGRLVGIGNASEAGEEIARISPGALEYPDVLEVRWEILCSHAELGCGGADFRTIGRKKAPGRPHPGFIAPTPCGGPSSGGLQRAWDALLPAAELFPQEPWIPYNLACYAAQFSRLDEAWEWFCRSLWNLRDKQALKRTALADPDLEALWAESAELAVAADRNHAAAPTKTISASHIRICVWQLL